MQTIFRACRIVLCLPAVLAACATNPDGTAFKASGLSGQAVNAALYPLDKTVYWLSWAAVAYVVLDPLSSNWEIQEARFPEQHFHLQLTMKRYYAGGAGEARQVFHRRAKELMRASGFDRYEVVEYSEGLDSSLIGSQRTALGVIRLFRGPAS